MEKVGLRKKKQQGFEQPITKRKNVSFRVTETLAPVKTYAVVASSSTATQKDVKDKDRKDNKAKHNERDNGKDKDGREMKRDRKMSGKLGK